MPLNKTTRPRAVLLSTLVLSTLVYFVLLSLFHWHRWIHAPGQLLYDVTSALVFGLVISASQWWQFRRQQRKAHLNPDRI